MLSTSLSLSPLDKVEDNEDESGSGGGGSGRNSPSVFKKLRDTFRKKDDHDKS